jgi:hypothetical protein
MKKMAVSGACRLCLESGDLCKSHIIPEFMYDVLYDDHHRFIAVDASGSGKVETMQKGYRERLLCRACEGYFGEWERQVAPVFVKLRQLLNGAAPGGVIRVASPYAVTKLFMLSLLWRASVARHPNFAAVNLGEHELLVRDMLVRALPASEASFPIVATAYSDIDALAKLIGPAGSNEIAGYRVAWLDIGGVRWLYFLSPSVTSLSSLPPLAIMRDEIRVTVSQRHEVEFLRQLAPLVP